MAVRAGTAYCSYCGKLTMVQRVEVRKPGRQGALNLCDKCLRDYESEKEETKVITRKTIQRNGEGDWDDVIGVVEKVAKARFVEGEILEINNESMEVGIMAFTREKAFTGAEEEESIEKILKELSDADEEGCWENTVAEFRGSKPTTMVLRWIGTY